MTRSLGRWFVILMLLGASRRHGAAVAGRRRRPLGLRQAGAPRPCPCQKHDVAEKPDRPLHPGPARKREAGAVAGSGARTPHPPRLSRPDRLAAEHRPGRCVRQRHSARRLRARRDGIARFASLRRALGSALARPRPLCRLQRLPTRRLSHHLAVSRLGDRRLQSRHAVRSIHARTDRRRSFAGHCSIKPAGDAGACAGSYPASSCVARGLGFPKGGDRVQSLRDGQQPGGGHRPRGEPRPRRLRSRQYHRHLFGEIDEPRWRCAQCHQS